MLPVTGETLLHLAAARGLVTLTQKILQLAEVEFILKLTTVGGYSAIDMVCQHEFIFKWIRLHSINPFSRIS